MNAPCQWIILLNYQNSGNVYLNHHLSWKSLSPAGLCYIDVNTTDRVKHQSVITHWYLVVFVIHLFSCLAEPLGKFLNVNILLLYVHKNSELRLQLECVLPASPASLLLHSHEFLNFGLCLLIEDYLMVMTFHCLHYWTQSLNYSLAQPSVFSRIWCKTRLSILYSTLYILHYKPNWTLQSFVNPKVSTFSCVFAFCSTWDVFFLIFKLCPLRITCYNLCCSYF